MQGYGEIGKSLQCLKADAGNIVENNKISYDISNIPEYSGEIFIEINNNIPEFTTEDINIDGTHYSNLENGRVRNGNDKN